MIRPAHEPPRSCTSLRDNSVRAHHFASQPTASAASNRHGAEGNTRWARRRDREEGALRTRPPPSAPESGPHRRFRRPDLSRVLQRARCGVSRGRSPAQGEFRRAEQSLLEGELWRLHGGQGPVEHELQRAEQSLLEGELRRLHGGQGPVEHELQRAERPRRGRTPAHSRRAKSRRAPMPSRRARSRGARPPVPRPRQSPAGASLGARAPANSRCASVVPLPARVGSQRASRVPVRRPVQSPQRGRRDLALARAVKASSPGRPQNLTGSGSDSLI